MKHLKKYESNNHLSPYYIIHIDSNWNKFLIALEKIEDMDTEKFLNSWGITNYDDLGDHNKEFFTHETIVFAILDKKTEWYIVRHNEKEVKRDVGSGYYLEFAGNIYVSDQELNTKKYNL